MRLLKELHIDYITFDEFRCAGSEHWGAAIQQVLTGHPDAKEAGAVPHSHTLSGSLAY